MTEKISFMERVESVLKQKKLTQTELAEKLNIRRPNLSDWKKNGAVPSGDIALKIAKYLNVSLEWLITGTEPEGLSLEEREILEKWNSLEEGQKETVTILLNALAEQNSKKERSPKAGA